MHGRDTLETKSFAPRQGDGGFTLVELLIALAITTLVVGLTLPALRRTYDQFTAERRIDDIVQTLELARIEAARRNEIVISDLLRTFGQSGTPFEFRPDGSGSGRMTLQSGPAQRMIEADVLTGRPRTGERR